MCPSEKMLRMLYTYIEKQESKRNLPFMSQFLRRQHAMRVIDLYYGVFKSEFVAVFLNCGSTMTDFPVGLVKSPATEVEDRLTSARAK